VQHASLGALFAGIRNPNPDWIDRAIGTDGNTAFIWHWYAGETHPLWENEFFNRSVGTVLMMHGPNPSDAGLPATSVHERADGVLVRTDGSVPQVRYVVSYVGVAGREIAHDDGLGLGLYRVDGPIVIVSHVYGLYVHDTWGRRLVTYKRFRCTGGTVVVQIGTDSQLFGRDQVITAREEGRVVARKRIAPTERAIMRVPLRPLAGVCTVRFLAATTRVPAEVLPGSSDTRPLAAHYYAFDYVAP
jgi:hypothetical protein